MSEALPLRLVMCERWLTNLSRGGAGSDVYSELEY
jgi:hypothetical protein